MARSDEAAVDIAAMQSELDRLARRLQHTSGPQRERIFQEIWELSGEVAEARLAAAEGESAGV